MSARDPVRELAEEIAESLFREANDPENHWLDESEDDYKSDHADRWEARLRSLLEERCKGRGRSRVSLDDGYAWLRASDRMNEKKLWDSIGRWAEGSQEVRIQEVPKIEGIVESAFVAGAALAHDENAELDSALTAALAEAAGLRGALEGLLKGAIVLSDEYMESVVGDRPDGDDVYSFSAGQWRRAKGAANRARSALQDCPPLSRSAAEVLEAAEEQEDSLDALNAAMHEESANPVAAMQKFDEANQRFHRAVRRYLALLRGEGEEG